MHCIFAEIIILITVAEEDVHNDSVTIMCSINDVSHGLKCSLCSISTIDRDVTMYTILTTGNISHINATFSSQSITLSNLTSGTTYNFCLAAIYAANMTEVGKSVCGNFITMYAAGNGTASMYTVCVISVDRCIILCITYSMATDWYLIIMPKPSGICMSGKSLVAIVSVTMYYVIKLYIVYAHLRI